MRPGRSWDGFGTVKMAQKASQKASQRGYFGPFFGTYLGRFCCYIPKDLQKSVPAKVTLPGTVFLLLEKGLKVPYGAYFALS
jgi:hypothetical protein